MFHFPLRADGSVCVYVAHMLLVLTTYYLKVLNICIYVKWIQASSRAQKLSSWKEIGMLPQTVCREDLFRTVCLFVCGIWPKLMNGFPRIELEGLGNNKALCQQVICSAAGMQRELEKLFHRSSFPGDAGGNVVNKKEKKRLERESEFRFRHSWRRFALFFWISFFFFVGGGFTHSSGPEIVPTNQGLHPECYRLNCWQQWKRQ